MEAKIFHLPLTWSAQRFRNYFDCQLKQEKQSWKKKILMQVCRQLNVSPKFLVHSSAGLWHVTKVHYKSQYWNQ